MQPLKFGKDSWSVATVYKRDGQFNAKAYHFICVECKMQYWHSYSDSRVKDHCDISRTYFRFHDAKFILLSRSTAFEIKYLREVSVDIELGRSFVDVSERFNRLYGTNGFRGELYRTRLEDAYFIYQLVMYHQNTIQVTIDRVSHRVNIDELCDLTMRDVFKSDNKWKSHECDVKGCKEGLVVCDGNEKLGRRICAAPAQHFKLGVEMPKILCKCGNSPAFGGQHKESSKFCHHHLYLDNDEPQKKKFC